MKKAIFLSSVTFWITGLSLYLLTFRKIILTFLKGERENIFLNWVISNFYPRFIVEKYRFDVYFFIQKADQIVWRLSLGFILVVLLWALYENHRKINFHKLCYQNTHKNAVLILVRLYFGAMLYFASDWWWLFYRLSKFSEFYQGVFLLKILNIPFIPYPSLALLWSIMLCNILLIFYGYRILINSILAVFLFIFLQGFLISFYKIDHSYTSFIYVGMWMPFLIREYHQVNKCAYESFILRMIQWTIIQVYLMAGLEKLLISGLNWIHPQNLRYYFLEASTPLGIFLAQFPIACTMLALFALLFELGFFLVLIPRLKYWLIGIGFLFHWGTFLLLGAGGWFSSWLMVYIFFIESQLLLKIRQRILFY